MEILWDSKCWAPLIKVFQSREHVFSSRVSMIFSTDELAEEIGDKHYYQCFSGGMSMIGLGRWRCEIAAGVES